MNILLMTYGKGTSEFLDPDALEFGFWTTKT